MGTFQENSDYNSVDSLSGNSKMNLRKPPSDSIFNLKFEMTVYVKIPSGISAGNIATDLYCYICSKEIYDFLDHMKQYHEKAFLCAICGIFFRSNYDLTNHVKNKCLIGKYGNENKTRRHSGIYDHSKFDCKYCWKKFQTTAQLKAHSKIHSSRLVYKCTKGACDAFFQTKDSLDKHLKSKCISKRLRSKIHGKNIVLDKELLQCVICDHVFPSIQHLKNHLLSHKSEQHDSQSEINKSHGQISLHADGKLVDSNTESGKNRDNQSRNTASSSAGDLEHEITMSNIQIPERNSHIENAISEIKQEKNDDNIKNECFDTCSSSYEKDPKLPTDKVSNHREEFNTSYFHCELCSEKFAEHEKFSNHVKQHSCSSDGNIICQECSKTFHSQKSYQSHFIKAHQTGSIYECGHCQKKFKDESMLKKHVKSKHKNEQKEFCCDECGTSFPIIKKLQNHMKIHVKEPDYECHVCNAKFKTSGPLKSHIALRHTEEKRFRCDQCGHCFKRKLHLTEHEAIHTGESQHKCDDCGKCFRTKSSLRVHVKTHGTPDKIFMCSICGRSFYSATVLKSHIFTHSGEKPFSCTVCEKRFNRNANLMQHLRIHTGEKPYTCDECGNSFNHVGTFRKHKLLHTDEKPHTCPTCGRNFRSLGNMTKHIWTHSGVKPYECQECGKKFRQNHHLTAHKATHLPKEKRNQHVNKNLKNSTSNIDHIVESSVEENAELNTMFQLQPMSMIPQTMVITPGLISESITLVSEENDRINTEAIQKQYMYNL